jgi:hypothetical protein
MNYRLEPLDNCFVIIEAQTDQIIKMFNTKEKAKKYLRHLNLGGGFDGWTPSFLLFNISGYINK